ncbi:MAG: AraC family transcriptional regulator [Proteobacteria bacterium]|nr:AraC family transcriptional regulator [Pseudomonadota bacterium]
MPMPAKSSALAPLYGNCLFRSDERVTVHDYVARELIDHELRWKRGRPDVAMYKGQASRMQVYLLRYGAEVEVTPQPFDDFALVHTSLTGAAEIESDAHRIELAEGRTAVLAPRQRLRLRWYPGTEQLIVKVPHALLRDVAGSEEDQPLGLPPGFMFARAHGAQWSLLLQSLLNVTTMPGAPGAAGMSRAWLEHFERNLALFLLTHQPDGLPAGAPIAGPGGVAQMEAAGEAPLRDGGDGRLAALMEYMEARLCAPITLEDLARAAGSSVRTLNQLCHRHYGVTPMDLLRNLRLDAVHARLRLHPELSITETALAFGFGHPGRFAQYYQARFNELPRQTQARHRDHD